MWLFQKCILEATRTGVCLVREVPLTVVVLLGSRVAVVPAHLPVELLRKLITKPWNQTNVGHVFEMKFTLIAVSISGLAPKEIW